MSAEPPRRLPRIVNGRGLISIGLMAVVFGGMGISDDLGFMRHAEQVPATVLAVESVTDATFPVGSVSLAYSVDGVDYRQTAPSSFRVPAVGEALTVAVDPRDPRDVRLMHPGDHWLLPGWAVLFGLVTIGFGVDRLRAERRHDAGALDDESRHN
jgi:hypothetical protein